MRLYYNLQIPIIDYLKFFFEASLSKFLHIT